MKKILVIVGPTAVGKTDISIDVAKALDTEIISCDSVQIYKRLDIGSAKPTIDEMQGVKHHLIDFVEPDQNYSVSEYRQDAQAVISKLHAQGKIPVITGGTGLYVNALLYEMHFGENASDETYRQSLESKAELEGNNAVHDLLKQVDLQASEKIHPNNIRRVIRALEINKVTGKNVGDFTLDPVRTKAYEVVLIGLTRERSKLYDRINRRVDLMLEAGLIEEVEKLKKSGLDDSFQSMQGIGYKEVLAYLNGLYDLDAMISLLKQNSRRYAKRQMTWFKRYEEIQWIDLETFSSKEAVVKTILSTI
ncbi:tRNA (adenosine(37)-N6)-dimethylallyltransferase MiaA [Fusibacter ferrireducens]|uniref:tRNA dimethylallyltransferase n=1 Tax=Fusibacter ferrireducens TaxID=2785058 RepID=A0ABR9ZT46_9FIRM|nr:tRNA (adenosine(37)-N6)-dimethylallyltransferase MiaA [Fusibacter ferrireducens]MBF4693617.1 tRNA (adenosine(37)-N6)-dimethylallyltransferase MiaA [Fusibacter ferrireducens]